MNTQWVEILHRGNGEATVVGVSDALELNFLPSLQRLLHKNLRGKREGTLSQFHEGFFVGTDTTSQTAQCVSRANHDGETYFVGSLQCVVHVLYGMRYRHFQIHLSQLLHKEVAVFCVHDSLYTCAQHFHAILLQYSILIQLCTTVQGCLSTKGQQNTVRTLLLDNLRHKMSGNWLEIHLVGNTFRSLNGSDVRIDQH